MKRGGFAVVVRNLVAWEQGAAELESALRRNPRGFKQLPLPSVPEDGWQIVKSAQA